MGLLVSFMLIRDITNTVNIIYEFKFLAFFFI